MAVVGTALSKEQHLSLNPITTKPVMTKQMVTKPGNRNLITYWDNRNILDGMIREQYVNKTPHKNV